MAARLTGRVRSIESCIRLLGYFHERLRYLRPTVQAMVAGAVRSGQFAELHFLPPCLEAMEGGVPFSTAWRSAVEADPALTGPEGALLAELAATLGSTDLDSQLAAITCTRELLEAHLTAAREEESRHGKLYRSLGVLCGLLVVLVVI